MKSFYCVLLLILSLSTEAQTTKSALFIGNSYTASNNLPLMVFNAAQSAGDSLIYDSRTPGGRRFLHHSADAQVMSKLFARDWDYVSLQGQSQDVAFDSATFYTDIYPHVQILCDTIRANRACSQPLFYTTWGRQNGDALNCPYLPWMCTYQGMDSALTANYTKLAQDNGAQMSPVGPVWNYIRSHYPAINLYSSDGSHPSLAGSYAAACTFYTSIFKKNPNLISWNSTLNSATADSIKMAVKRIVYDSINHWNFSTNYPKASFSYVNTSTQVMFQIDSINQIDSALWDFGDGNFSHAFNPTHVYGSVGNYTVSLTVFACGFQDTYTDSVAMIISHIESFNKEGYAVEIFPNPAQQWVFIDSKNQIVSNIQLFDGIGKEVTHRVNICTASDHRTSIHLNHLARGIYFIKIGNQLNKILKLK